MSNHTVKKCLELVPAIFHLRDKLISTLQSNLGLQTVITLNIHILSDIKGMVKGNRKNFLRRKHSCGFLFWYYFKVFSCISVCAAVFSI